MTLELYILKKLNNSLIFDILNTIFCSKFIAVSFLSVGCSCCDRAQINIFPRSLILGLCLEYETFIRGVLKKFNLGPLLTFIKGVVCPNLFVCLERVAF